MKRFIILVLSLMFPASLALGQSDKFKCNYDDWANRFNSNSEWNSLLESACKDINASRYSEALSSLKRALTIDSLANQGDMNVFIESQYRRLKDYIEFEHPEAEKNENSKKEPEKSAEEQPIQIEQNNEVKQPVGEATETAEVKTEVKAEEKKEEVLTADPVPVEKAVSANEERNTPLNETRNTEVTGEKKKEEVAEQSFETPASKQEEPVAETIEPVQKAEEIIPEQSPATTGSVDIEQSNTATEPAGDAGVNGKVSFSEEEKAEFQEKGMQKVKQLESFLIQIGSKSTPLSMSSQAIDNAVQLFDREDRTVQVSSVNNETKPKFKVKTYLQKIRNLNYDEVQIEWADFQYASDFYMGKDGNYYAYVVFSQRFTGTSDNKVMYQDITTKRTEIVLKFYEKASQGELKKMWDVFLGDISVMQTESF